MWIRFFSKILFSPDFWSVVLIVLIKSRNLIFKKKFMEQDPVSETLQNSLPEDDRRLQPLGLPRGSIRAVLVLLFTIAVIASFFFPYVVLPDYFLEFWLVMIGYYAGYRTDNTPVKKII